MSKQSNFSRRYATTTLALLVGWMLLLMASTAIASVTLDFNDLQHGQIVDTEYSSSNGLTISGVNVSSGPDLIVAFDTFANPTNDPDLEDPFDLGNAARDPGNLLGLLDTSIPDPNGTSDVSRFHKALIIQENGREDPNNPGFIDSNPDDEGSRPAGAIFFDFESPITEVGFDLLDIEGPEEFGTDSGYVATFYVNNTELGRVGFNEFITSGNPFFDSTVQFGNNSANRILPITVAKLNEFLNLTGDDAIEKFDRVEINLGGSGAVDNLTYVSYTPPPDQQAIPEPASVFVWAMLGLTVGSYKRRTLFAS